MESKIFFRTVARRPYAGHSMPTHPTGGRPHATAAGMERWMWDAVFRIEKVFAIISQEGDDYRETSIGTASAYFV
jgi:hypothetical protein